MHGGRAYDFLPLCEKLLAFDGYPGGRVSFLQEYRAPRGYQFYCRLSHAHVHSDINKWTQLIFRERERIREIER